MWTHCRLAHLPLLLLLAAPCSRCDGSGRPAPAVPLLATLGVSTLDNIGSGGAPRNLLSEGADEKWLLSPEALFARHRNRWPSPPRPPYPQCAPRLANCVPPCPGCRSSRPAAAPRGGAVRNSLSLSCHGGQDQRSLRAPARPH